MISRFAKSPDLTAEDQHGAGNDDSRAGPLYRQSAR